MTSLRSLSLALLLTANGALAVEHYGYRIVEQRPQPRENFVQGLEIVGDQLLVGTGMYGESRLRRYDFATMQLLAEKQLHPQLFGEGVTQFGDRIYQLTWRSRVGIVFRAQDLQPLETFRLPGEGWGITHDEQHLIYSDGSDLLRFLDPVTRELKRTLAVTLDGEPLRLLNELEWIDDRVWANVWRSNQIVVIDPQAGEVEAVIDLAGLLPLAERLPDTDVLNGIARDPSSGAIWVTGKRWPWLYRIELVPDEKRAVTEEKR